MAISVEIFDCFVIVECKCAHALFLSQITIWTCGKVFLYYNNFSVKNQIQTLKKEVKLNLKYRRKKDRMETELHLLKRNKIRVCFQVYLKIR